jgi:hypothetical protein
MGIMGADRESYPTERALTPGIEGMRILDKLIWIDTIPIDDVVEIAESIHMSIDRTIQLYKERHNPTRKGEK